MDSSQLSNEPSERRRLQNRIAQRRFRQKKQLERIVDRALSVQPDRLLPAHPNTNGDNTTLIDRPTEAPDLLFAIPNTPSPGDAQANHMGGGIALDLETIDNLLDSYNPDPSLDAPALSSYLASANTVQTLYPDTDNAPDIATRARRSSLHEIDTHGEEPSPSRGFPGATPVADTAHGPFETNAKKKGWLGSVHIAAQKGHERILRVLLEQGNMDPNSADSDGRTPLFHAAVGGHQSVVRLLLSHGASIANLDCDRRYVLHWAAHYQRLEVLRTLLEHWMEHERDSYDINAYDDHGWTPLHLAVERGFEEGVILLIQFGADMNAKARKCWLTDQVIPFDLNQLV
ncbi:ankyrin repeat-containing domain protein [Aspergillus cavernicola]|uniref:Ankyrin repeat-containing domain protein n=1 Tax=Aspergillus cavernicola TaxID=176166 RepID=A0ABR4IMZ5_9EURO